MGALLRFRHRADAALDDESSSANPTLLDSGRVVVGPAKNCDGCGTSVRDADVNDLKKMIRVHGQPQPLITSDGEVVVGYLIHDPVLCQQIGRGERAS